MKKHQDDNGTRGGQITLYRTADGAVQVPCLLRNETLWLTQKAIAELFGVKVPAISKHLTNIFESSELEENQVVSILETTAADGKSYQTQAAETIHDPADASLPDMGLTTWKRAPRGKVLKSDEDLNKTKISSLNRIKYPVEKAKGIAPKYDGRDR